jgi:hypothetical protein
MNAKIAVFLVILSGIALAAPQVTMLYPKQLTFTYVSHGDYPACILTGAELGDIGPGQTLTLVIDRSSGAPFPWSQVTLTPPYGWAKEDTIDPVRDITNMTVTTTVPMNAASGRYILKMTTESLRGELECNGQVELGLTVKRFSYSFPAGFSVEAGRCSKLPVVIRSTSLVTETFSFNRIEGLPAKWSKQATFTLNPGETRTVELDVCPMDEGMYYLKFSALTSAGIREQGVSENYLRVKPTLKSKFQSFGEGFSIAPAILQPFYSLLSFFGI